MTPIAWDSAMLVHDEPRALRASISERVTARASRDDDAATAKSDIAYYAKREREERESAARADDVGVRRVHLNMAQRYAALLGEPADY